MTTTRRILATAISVLGLGACAKHHEASTTAVRPQHEAQATAARTQPERLPTTSGQTQPVAQRLSDAQVLGAAIGASRSAVTEAQVAIQKSTNPAVRQFATRIVSDHGESAREFQALAGRRGIRPETSMIARYFETTSRNELASLDRLSGSALDRQYIDHEVMEHRDLLDTIDGDLVPSTHDPEIRQKLADMRSMVESHLELGRLVQSQLPR